MLVLESVKAMVEAATQEIIPACLVNDIARAFDGTGEVNWVDASLEQPEITLGEIFDKPFMDLVGGNINVCQTEEDLKAILSYDADFFKEHNREPNIMDKPASWDVMNYVFDNPDNKFVAAAMMTNNMGGDLFYIPEELWEAARVKEHLEMQSAYMQQMYGGDEPVFILE